MATGRSSAKRRGVGVNERMNKRKEPGTKSATKSKQDKRRGVLKTNATRAAMNRAGASERLTKKSDARRSGGDSTMYKGKAPYGRTEDGSPYTRKGIVARSAEGPKKSMPRKKTSAKKRTR
jgi:hypothetical protein